MPHISLIRDFQLGLECTENDFVGMLEVLRTQGLWVESLRLAFLQAIKGAVAVPLSADSPQDAEAGLKRCPAPTHAQLQVRIVLKVLSLMHCHCMLQC